ncbi:hypothetical protein SNE40_016149 [Patella caerulea]|uniref:Folate receptor-like domain-containing protein n=1 Tax=Patella caerulea TaxID=87958 RepID=A0AAN8PCQ7_PATCE
MGQLRDRTTVEELASTCIEADGFAHKYEPSPEPDLYEHCRPWKGSSCCTRNTSELIHTSDVWLSLEWNHCGNMSAKCLRKFHRETCFFQCSPNLGPWITTIVFQNALFERYRDVPLCESDCMSWWDACKDDLTCVANWAGDFNYTGYSLECPANTTCKSFTEIYGNSTNFCEIIWNHDYKVVPDREPCMHHWFAEGSDNPNDKIALDKAKELFDKNQTTTIFTNITLLILLLCTNFM